MERIIGKKGSVRRITIMSLLLVLSLSVLFYFVMNVFALNTITEDSSNPANGTVTSNSSIVFNYNISTNNGEGMNLDLLKFGFGKTGNITNYTLYQGALVIYNMDNRSTLSETSAKVVDLSKMSNNGTVTGTWTAEDAEADWTPNGKYNGAYNFDSDDFIVLNATLINISNANPITFALWFYPTSYASYKVIYVMGTADNRNGYYIKMDYVNNQVIASRSNDTSGGYEIGTGTNSVSLNSWNHLTMTFNGTIREVYINGILKGTRTETTGSSVVQNATTRARIGDSLLGYNNGLNGSIDDFIILNRSLSADEVLQLSKSQYTQYDSQNRSFLTNQSMNSSLSNSTYNTPYDSYLCSSNSSNSENCSIKRTILNSPTQISITANFTTNIGTIRGDFYGVNSKLQPSDLMFIDIFGNGTYSTLGNKTFYEEAVANGRFGITRTAMFLFDCTADDGTFKNTSGLYCNVDGKKQMVESAYNHGRKIMLIADQTPPYMRNDTDGYCNSTHYESCRPRNYTEYANKVVDYIDYVTNNGQWNSSVIIEIKNEPDGEGWLNNLSVKNPIKSVEYNKLYNATYDAIKLKYPNMLVGGFGGGYRTLTSGSLFLMQNFFGNFSNKIDYFSYHSSLDYPTESNYYTLLQGEYNSILGNMTFYNVTNRIIYISETNVYNSTIQNSSTYSNLHGTQIGLSLLSGLNSYPSNISIDYYTLYKQVNYSTGRDSEYPFRFEMVGEPQLDNVFYSIYNTTKKIAILCPANGIVKQMSCPSPLYCASCRYGNQSSIIIFNSGTISYTVVADLTNSGLTTLKNYENITQTFTISANTNFGVLDINEARFLTEDLQSPTISIQSPTSSSYDSTTIYFNITLDEEGSWCGYSLDGSANVTMAKQGVIFDFKAVNSTMSDKLHTVVFTCNDTSNNFNSTSIQFRTDVNLPNGTLLVPSNNSFNSTTTQNLTANLSDPAGIKNATIYVYNQSGFFNSTVFTFASNVVNAVVGTINNFVDGVYTWWVSVWDWVGNTSTSGNYTLTIDTINPSVNSLTFTPSNPAEYLAVNTYIFNATVTDTNLQKVLFEFNGINYTATNISANIFNVTLTNLGVGSYSYSWFANDSAGNVNNSRSGTYYINDTTAPNVELVSQTTNAGNYSMSNIYLNVTASDQSNYSVISNIGLKLWLRLNNETGENSTFVKDWSGNSNNGTASNGAYYNSSGKLGGCFSFDGSNDVLTIQNNTSLNITKSITISTWVKINKFISYRRIIAKSPATNVYPYTIYGLLTDTTIGGKNLVRMELASGGYQHIIRSTTNITTGSWYMVTGTYNYNTNETKLYINGVLDNSTLIKSYSNGTTVIVNSLYNGKIDSNSVPVTIGDAYYGAVPVNASIDEVLIYNRALTSDEILSMYNATKLDKNLTNIEDATYNITAYAQDIYGNLNTSTSRTIILDTTNPTVNLISPEDGTQDTDEVVRFLYSVSDVHGVDNCSLYYQLGIYSTSSSITKDTTNLIEVVSINNQHVLYSDDLRWYVKCTDNFGNTGTSSTYKLDTKPDVAGGGTGGGTTTGGTTTTTGNASENPKYVDVLYPETWNRGTEIKVRIKAYNQTENIYAPKNVTYQYSINGVSLTESSHTDSGEVISIFKVSNSAELGSKTIRVLITDQRTVTKDITFEIDDGITTTGSYPNGDPLDQKFQWIFWIVIGMLVLIFFVLLLVAMTRDHKK